MHDSEVAAAIVAGDPDGLAEAYDRYAAPLYTYCRSLLREPADAADAVQDTFVIAASKLAGLRDQSRLRPWLYAVARNECHRRLREKASAVTSALDQVPEMSDESADVAEGAERAELRALLRSAVRGLGASEQDLIQLQLRQELDVAEIAAVLGVSRNHAHALLSRARAQLEVSLGALLVARSGRGDCEALGALLGDWDGQLNVLMRKRINRHIERCPACTERKRRELAPALLLGLAPLPIAVIPPGLRTPGQRGAAGRHVRARRFPQAAGPAEIDMVAGPYGAGRRGGRRRSGGGGSDHPGADRRVRHSPWPAERAEPRHLVGRRRRGPVRRHGAREPARRRRRPGQLRQFRRPGQLGEGHRERRGPGVALSGHGRLDAGGRRHLALAFGAALRPQPVA